jgi:hypothetical protein
MYTFVYSYTLYFTGKYCRVVTVTPGGYLSMLLDEKNQLLSFRKECLGSGGSVYDYGMYIYIYMYTYIHLYMYI